MGRRRGQQVTETSNPNEIINWLESLSGALSTVEEEFGGVAELVECKEWDESKTDYLLRLLAGLKESVSSLETELRNHVNGKSA